MPHSPGFRKLAVAAAITVAVVMIGAVVTLAVRRYLVHRRIQMLHEVLDAWNEANGRMPAERAAAEWDSIRWGYREYFHTVPIEKENGLLLYLREKFFWEGKYGRAFDYVEKARELVPKPTEDGFTIYLAGLAGRRKWLKELAGRAGAKEGMGEVLIAASLHWAARDYAGLLEKTDPKGWPAQTARLSSTHEYVYWVFFLRARALMRKGRAELAWNEIAVSVSEGLPGGLDEAAMLHYLIVGSEIAEKVGEIDVALSMSMVVKRYFDRYGEVSWTGEALKIDQQVARLKRLKATTQSLAD